MEATTTKVTKPDTKVTKQFGFVNGFVQGPGAVDTSVGFATFRRPFTTFVTFVPSVVTFVIVRA